MARKRLWPVHASRIPHPGCRILLCLLARLDRDHPLAAQPWRSVCRRGTFV